MSTVDSQILSCSAAISQSLVKRKTSCFFNKVVTVILIIITSLVALFAKGSVFDLVVFAYSVLGVTLGSALVIQVLLPKMKESICLFIVVLSGAGTVVWVLAGYKNIAPEALIGFLISFTLMIFYKIFYLFKKQ